MHRFLFGGKTKTPTATNLQNQKTKQIDSLRKTNLGAIEVIRDEEYRVTFLCGATNIILIINLPLSFPQEKPTVTVQPYLQHPWVDMQMKVTGCANINNFSMHSDLGQAIQAIVEEFRRIPPRILPHMLNQTPPSLYPGVAQPLGGMSSGYSNYTPGNNFGNFSNSVPPPIPPRVPKNGTAAGLESEMQNCDIGSRDFLLPDILKAFPALKDKKLFELQELVDNEEKIFELIQELPEISKFARDREDLSSQCVELARENLLKRPIIEELKNTVLQKCSELDEVKESLEVNCEHHMTLSDEYDLTHIQTNLKVAVMEAEEETEKIAEDFLDKKLDLETFIQSFLQKRTLCHKRKAKEEKLSQIIMVSGAMY